MSSSVVYPYQNTTNLSDGPNPMCRTMRLNVYLRSFAVGLLKRVLLLDEDIGTSKAEFFCGLLCV